ncbi:class I SAM-dependent methyltransferase [Chitinophaga barathri]|uniref:Class I SAM-dependent methyltransferase n=1 Tax=Chitinophaga barathri TaxID=1647451 RepID=A0A3N4MFN2_9BACT|nr:class I SAM-dependent methyltransferase [Chitinophaga barathri]RPD40487.1 class I SAM-dependent methyltransferase [Chitinophaga barathri]
MEQVICKICNTSSNLHLEGKVLSKYVVKYFKCASCGFIQTEQPYWLQEAYKNAITSLDIGLLTRNNHLLPIIQAIVLKFYDPTKQFIDYGGGYGVLVRLMRDAGFDYYRQDIYCENLFAKHFDITDLSPDNLRFELLTAFEVFEHLENPVAEMEKMLKYSDNILFSTELQPNQDVNFNNWWYFTPETGQHISLFTLASLEALAGRFGLHLYSNGKNIHLLTKKRLSSFTFSCIVKRKIARAYSEIFNRKPSYLPKDFNSILNKIRQ